MSFLIYFVVQIFEAMLDTIPDATGAIPQDIVTLIVDVIEGAYYVLPVGDMIVIFLAWFVVKQFHFVYAMVMRIWDAIPLT